MRTLTILILITVLIQSVILSYIPCHRVPFVFTLQNALKISTNDSTLVSKLRDKKVNLRPCVFKNFFILSIENQIAFELSRYFTVGNVRLVIEKEEIVKPTSIFSANIEIVIDGKVEMIKNLKKYYEKLSLRCHVAKITKLTPVFIIKNCKDLCDAGKKLFNCYSSGNTTKGAATPIPIKMTPATTTTSSTITTDTTSTLISTSPTTEATSTVTSTTIKPETLPIETQTSTTAIVTETTVTNTVVSVTNAVTETTTSESIVQDQSTTAT